MSVPVHVLLYRSMATRTLPPGELLTLIKRAEANNAARGITGLLLHGLLESLPSVPGAFVQWLEGPEAEVLGVFEDIKRDPRHQDIEVLVSAPALEVSTRERHFPAWAMGLETMASLPVSLNGFLRFYEERGFGIGASETA